MEETVEELIKRGLKNLRREKTLHKKMIEAQVIYSDRSFQEFQREYQKCKQVTSEILAAICEKTKNNSESLGSLVISCGEELEQENGREYDNLTFIGLILTQKFINKEATFLDPIRVYAQQNSVFSEYQVIFYELFLNYLRENKDLGPKEKRRLLDEFSKVTIGSEAIRKMFEGDIETAKFICTPELFLEQEMLKPMVKKQSQSQLREILKNISSPVVTFLNKLSKTDPRWTEKDYDTFLMPLKIKTAALCVQCERHGISLESPDIVLTEEGVKFLEDTKTIVEKYRNEKNKELTYN